MPQVRHDIQQLAGLGDTYANAAPDLFDALNSAVVTSRTINQQQKQLDQALLSAAGFGNTGADIFQRGGPYLARGAEDLVPTAQLLDTYSPSRPPHPIASALLRGPPAPGLGGVNVYDVLGGGPPTLCVPRKPPAR